MRMEREREREKRQKERDLHSSKCKVSSYAVADACLCLLSYILYLSKEFQIKILKLPSIIENKSKEKSGRRKKLNRELNFCFTTTTDDYSFIRKKIQKEMELLTE